METFQIKLYTILNLINAVLEIQKRRSCAPRDEDIRWSKDKGPFSINSLVHAVQLRISQ